MGFAQNKAQATCNNCRRHRCSVRLSNCNYAIRFFLCLFVLVLLRHRHRPEFIQNWTFFKESNAINGMQQFEWRIVDVWPRGGSCINWTIALNDHWGMFAIRWQVFENFEIISVLAGFCECHRFFFEWEQSTIRDVIRGWCEWARIWLLAENDLITNCRRVIHLMGLGGEWPLAIQNTGGWFDHFRRRIIFYWIFNCYFQFWLWIRKVVRLFYEKSIHFDQSPSLPSGQSPKRTPKPYSNSTNRFVANNRAHKIEWAVFRFTVCQTVAFSQRASPFENFPIERIEHFIIDDWECHSTRSLVAYCACVLFPVEEFAISSFVERWQQFTYSSALSNPRYVKHRLACTWIAVEMHLGDNIPDSFQRLNFARSIVCRRRIGKLAQNAKAFWWIAHASSAR